jgi:cobalt-zinc-cadmium efflux system outer membrane protein
VWGQAYSADDLIRIAAAKSRALQALEQRVAEARGLLRLAGVRPGPSLEFDGATGKPLGSPGKEEFSAGYSHPIEISGKRDKRIRVAEKAVELAEAELAEQSHRLIREIKLQYLDAINEQAKLDTLERLLEAYRESLKLTQARVEHGDAAPLEAQLLAVDLNRTVAQRSAANGRLQLALSNLRRLCVIDPGKPLSLTAAEPVRTARYAAADLQRRALELRPDLRIARLAEEQGSAEVALTEAQSRPDLTLSARYSHRNERFNDLYGIDSAGRPAPLRDSDNILSAGISIPLFTGRRNAGNVQAAAARANTARLLRQHLEAAIPLVVEAAWQRWAAAEESLGILSTGVVRQSEKNLEVIRQAYTLGQLRLLDVLNEQRRLIDTELGFIEAEFEVKRALVELEQAVGGDLK